MTLYISPPPRNPVTALLAVLAGMLLLVGAFFLGFIVLVIAASVGLLAWTVIVLRVKWLAWKLRRQGIDLSARPPGRESGFERHESSIDAEYTVISRDSED